MEGYTNSYQNGTSARETEFQRLAQNVGTNIQKILQNGQKLCSEQCIEVQCSAVKCSAMCLFQCRRCSG